MFLPLCFCFALTFSFDGFIEVAWKYISKNLLWKHHSKTCIRYRTENSAHILVKYILFFRVCRLQRNVMEGSNAAVLVEILCKNSAFLSCALAGKTPPYVQAKEPLLKRVSAFLKGPNLIIQDVPIAQSPGCLPIWQLVIWRQWSCPWRYFNAVCWHI